MARLHVDHGTNEILGRGSLAVLSRYRHALGEVRDPLRETVSEPTVVLTTRGRWGFGSERGGGLVDPSSVVLLDADVEYRVVHPEGPLDQSVSVTYLRPIHALLEANPDLFPDRAPGRVFPTWAVSRTPAIDRIRRQLLAATREPTLRGLAIDALATQLLVAIQRAHELGEPSAAHRSRRAERTARVETAVAFMRTRLPEDLRLADVARAAGVSPFHLARLFRDEVGDPPMRYLRLLRLERAATLLRSTDDPVTEIALAVGFGSLSHFIACFRAETGRTPSAFRAQERDTRASTRKPRADTRT